MPFYERQPYIQPLHQVITEVMRGDIRCPRFQRPGTEVTWRPEQRGDLLDSLYRGFPVGTILLWSTGTEIPTLDIVGDICIPPPASGGVQRLLLDGHQRLSTLVQILGPGLIADLAREGIKIKLASADDAGISERRERWVFELEPARKSSGTRDRFVLLKPDQEPTPTQVPLNIVLSRSNLNRWIRNREVPLSDDQSAAADGLRDRLREYALPVAVLVADSLEEATESFKRVNSSGTPMSDFHMVAALAFTNDSDPQQQFAEARSSHLAPIGWGSTSDSDVLRVCAGIEKTNPARLEVDALAARLREDQGLVQRAFEAVAAAATLLRGCGVHGPESLPYAWQLITLAVYLGRSDGLASPGPSLTDAAQRWFWLTTYGEVFAGGNSAVFERSQGALADMIGGRSWSRMERDVTRQVRPADGFDFRTARSKACALAMARHQDSDNRDGPAHRALTAGAEAMQLLATRGRRSIWWHLAIVTPEHDLSRLREVLRRHERGTPQLEDPHVLKLLGVETADRGALLEILAARRDRLQAAEEQFVSELGLSWAPRDSGHHGPPG